MKKIVVALMVCASSVAAAQTAKPAAKSAVQAHDLTVDELRTLANRAHLLRAEPNTLTLHLGQTVSLTTFTVTVIDGAGRKLGITTNFDFAVKPGEPASVFPKHITGDRLGKTVLTLRYPKTAWAGAPASRPSVDVPVTIIK